MDSFVEAQNSSKRMSDGGVTPSKTQQSHAVRFSFIPVVVKSTGLKPIETQNARSSSGVFLIWRLYAIHGLTGIVASWNRLNLLECRCGGQPEKNILDLCSRYTGIEFSLAGLQTARSTLSGSSTPTRFLNADVCALPFANDSFDAVYCAQMLVRSHQGISRNTSLSMPPNTMPITRR